MIYWQLFIAFFEIGAVSFGGGYGMISLIRDKVMAYGWLSAEDFLNLIAVSEATPGPIAVNMATFIGSTQAGVLGSFVATLGAILPSFILVLIITALVGNFLKYAGVHAFLQGVRPCVAGLILATALIMLLEKLFNLSSLTSTVSPNVTGLIIGAILVAIAVIYQIRKHKSPSPIVMLIISGVLGIGSGIIEEVLTKFNL